MAHQPETPDITAQGEPAAGRAPGAADNSKARGPLTGKTALVTGAARRVGAAITRALHGAGASVILHYRSSGDDAAQLAAELNGVRPGSAATAECDLLQPAQLPELVAEAQRKFAGLDILVNNASGPEYRPDRPLDLWTEIMETELVGTMYCVRHAIDAMRGGGAIVNI
ncbi:MAG TPA: SDR family NAD(P)-dependent oxidoreductase, partial [Stellaceae bacterium]|nr:SDR family NAD(P)-dependent oxidoreductase [Stellaceae bacterium]